MTSKLTSIADEKIEDVIKMARESAKIYGGEWDSALIAESPGNNVHGITSDHIEAVVVKTADDSLHSSWLCDYLESVSPAFVIAALTELQERRKAAMDSEPVAYIFKHPAGRLFWSLTDESNKGHDDVMPVYASPQPAPVCIPTFEEWCDRTEQKPVGWVRDAMKEAYDACRAAMLAAAQQSPGSEPATVPGKWIPVSEGMPEVGDIVLAAMGGAVIVSETECTATGLRFFTAVISGRELPATHWMPLPAAPQEAQGE